MVDIHDLNFADKIKKNPARDSKSKIRFETCERICLERLFPA